MHDAVVVDASIWVSGFTPRDINHEISRDWVERYIVAGGILVLPAFVLIEVAGAISRLSGQPVLARQAVRDLYYVNAIRFMDLRSLVMWAAVEVSADLQLRAGDATYVAVAHRLNIPLVSWDREQLKRASTLIPTYTPNDYPF